MAEYHAPISSNNDGAALAAQVTPQTIWAKAFEHFEFNTDFYAPVEGNSPNSIIIAKTDTSVGNGQKMKIRVESEFGDEPHFGDDTFATEDDFEQLLHSEYELTVDLIRHATSFTERAEELIGIRNELRDGIPAKEGRWLGRRKTEELDMMFAHSVPSDNRFYSGGKAADGLTKADGLTWNFVMNTVAAMQSLGGQQGKMGTFSRDNQPGLGFALVTTSDAATILRQDSTYVDYVKNAGPQGALNSLFTGTTTLIDGTLIVDRRVIDSDAEGAIGSPLNPKARLGIAIASGDAPLEIRGGGNPTSAVKEKKKYFKYFDGYAYKFAGGNVLSPASASRYLLIINPPNAATDPNKIGMYEYTTGNNGHKITVTKRLGASSGTTRASTVGSVTWNTGIWAGKHTDVHPANALIVQCNALGEPIGRSFLLGRGAAMRGYGKYRGKRTTETADGGVLHRTFIQSYFGQQIRYDRQGRAPGVAVLEHSLHYPYLNLPNVV